MYVYQNIYATDRQGILRFYNEMWLIKFNLYVSFTISIVNRYKN